jgi:hypothetical protein
LHAKKSWCREWGCGEGGERGGGTALRAPVTAARLALMLTIGNLSWIEIILSRSKRRNIHDSEDDFDLTTNMDQKKTRCATRYYLHLRCFD